MTEDKLANFDLIDLCPKCHFFWFEKGELNLVLVEAKLAENKREETFLTKPELGLFSWKKIPAFFLIPIESKADQFEQFPTWTLLLSFVCIGIYSISLLDNNFVLLSLLGFVPAEPNLVSWLGSAFLHLGMIHLLSNLYMLITFGDNVEAHFGSKTLVTLFLGGQVFGCLLHKVIEGGSSIPIIGASFGVSSVMAFYICEFPFRRLSFSSLNVITWPIWTMVKLSSVKLKEVMSFLSSYRWIPVHAWWFLVFWLILETSGALKLNTNIAHLGHLGGAIFGILFCWLVRPTDKLNKKSQ